MRSALPAIKLFRRPSRIPKRMKQNFSFQNLTKRKSPFASHSKFWTEARNRTRKHHDLVPTSHKGETGIEIPFWDSRPSRAQTSAFYHSSEALHTIKGHQGEQKIRDQRISPIRKEVTLFSHPSEPQLRKKT